MVVDDQIQANGNHADGECCVCWVISDFVKHINHFLFYDHIKLRWKWIVGKVNTCCNPPATCI